MWCLAVRSQDPRTGRQKTVLELMDEGVVSKVTGARVGALCYITVKGDIAGEENSFTL